MWLSSVSDSVIIFGSIFLIYCRLGHHLHNRHCLILGYLARHHDQLRWDKQQPSYVLKWHHIVITIFGPPMYISRIGIPASLLKVTGLVALWMCYISFSTCWKTAEVNILVNIVCLIIPFTFIHDESATTLVYPLFLCIAQVNTS